MADLLIMLAKAVPQVCARQFFSKHGKAGLGVISILLMSATPLPSQPLALVQEPGTDATLSKPPNTFGPAVEYQTMMRATAL